MNTIDATGQVVPLDPTDPNFEQLKREEANKDVSEEKCLGL
jgi:hypothetical protein